MRKKVYLIAAIPVCLILIVGICAYLMFATQIKAANTVKKLSNDLYYMEYSGDYGFPAFLEQGGAASSIEVAEYVSMFLSKGYYKYDPATTTHGCSTFSVKLSDGGYGFGRNFDWDEDCIALIIKTIPKDGYASISTANLDFVGFGDGFKPESFINKFLSLAAIYVPLDGMNEKGLCIGDLQIEYPEGTHQNTGKTNLTTTTAIRMLLDYAANVDEAIALLEQYDMHSDIGTMHHLAVSDASGRSVVVEYIDNVMYITETLIVTNHFLTPGDIYGKGSENNNSMGRFSVLSQLFIDMNGVMDMKGMSRRSDISNDMNCVMDMEGIKNGLAAASDWDTQWSVVYNKSTLDVLFHHKRNYQQPYSFNLN
jgi:predicted choloylglycine hydrolase